MCLFPGVEDVDILRNNANIPRCPFLECLPQGSRAAEFSVCLVQALLITYDWTYII